MPNHGQAVVTGAFSNIVRYGVRSLLKERRRCQDPDPQPHREHPVVGRVPAAPLDLGDRRIALVDGQVQRSLQHLLGTVRARADHLRAGGGELKGAVRGRSQGGRWAGIVHFSVANASSESRLPYFRGKGQVEEILTGMGSPYAIIRPTLVFGEGDLLLNNMAWALRRFPVFPVFGDGNYRIQPIFAEDLAAQAVDAGCQSGSLVVDAAGPVTFTFKELLRLLAKAVGARVRLVHTPPSLGFALTRLVGLLLRGVVHTRE